MALIPLKDLKIDIKKHAQEIILGPQGELFESLKDFNFRYRLNLKLKNNFSWNRGTYKAVEDKAKEIFISKRYRSRHIMGIFSNTFGSEYRMRDFKMTLSSINQRMSQMRYKGLKVMDANIDIEPLWEQFLEHIELRLALANKLFPSVIISVAIKEGVDHYSVDKIVKQHLALKISFTENNIIKCYDDKGKEVLDVVELYPFTLIYSNDLFSAFNGWASFYEKNEDEKYKLIQAARRRSSRYQQHARGWQAQYHPKYKALRHPYIGSPRADGNIWTNVCFGDFVSDISLTTEMLDFPSLIHILEEWTSMYHVGLTNPLQNMQYWRLGVPKSLTMKQANFSGMDPQWCYQAQAGEGKSIDFLIACDDCQLNPINMIDRDDNRDECEYYARHQQITNKESLNEESIDILAEMLMKWTKDVILRDRILNNVPHTEEDMAEVYDKVDGLKSDYMHVLLNRIQTRFRDLLTNSLGYRRYRALGAAYPINEAVLRQARTMEDTISTCKSEWFQEHHNGYDRLVNEIDLWNKSFSKMRQNTTELDPSDENKEKEAWLAMLKRTEQEVTPIGR